uniref:Uncharacterized protein n=1 Tax=Romanomermis culicivorax TaxID=13658 RepID=A0A915JB86_ROMCU
MFYCFLLSKLYSSILEQPIRLPKEYVHTEFILEEKIQILTTYTLPFKAVKCRYTTSKICRYTHPGICNGVEARRSSTRTTNCPARHKHVNCEPYECDEDCDKRTTPWSQWSSCPACVPADVARPPIATRDRRLVREEEVYCVTKQGRLCSKLPLCRDIGDDDSVSHQETLIKRKFLGFLSSTIGDSR